MTDLAAFNPFTTGYGGATTNAFDARPQVDFFASSLSDFVNPGDDVQRRPAPTFSLTQALQTSTATTYHSPPHGAKKAPTPSVAFAKGPSASSISISAFWSHPNSTTRMLLLVAKLHKTGAISADEKGRLKDQVLRGTITEAELQQRGPAAAPASAAFQLAPASFYAEPSVKQAPASSSTATWATVEGTLLVLDGVHIKPSSKIASFDMDDTLITTKSGRSFAINGDDWKWWHPKVPDRLRELHAQGYKLVIFTNQAGISKGNAQAKDIQRKIQDIAAELGLPLQAFVATSEDKWRKPSTAMWELFVTKHNGGVAVDMQHSFYCGDAAGRARAWNGDMGTKKDHSCSDRKFGRNVGLPFLIPETCFHGQPDATDIDWGSIDPTAVAKDLKAYDGPLTSSSQEMILCVGFPASGKSTFTKRNLVPQGYVHINQDTLRTKAACMKAAVQAISQGKSVVIDNTNPSAEVRREYAAIAQQNGVPVRCFVFRTPLKLAQHLNSYRETVFGVKHVPDIAYNLYKNKFQEPSPSEGFAEIKEINFVPQFDDAEKEKLFHNLT